MFFRNILRSKKGICVLVSQNTNKAIEMTAMIPAHHVIPVTIDN